MITRRHLLLAIAATCLLTMFITILPIRSETFGVYNPWYDVNDDNKIDGKDVALVCLDFGTGSGGNDLNKTLLLIDVNNTFTELLNTINGCNASLIDLQGRVTALESIDLPLNATISTIQSRIDILNASLLDIVSRTNSLNASVINIQSRTTTLEGEVAQLQTNVTALQNNLINLNSTVTLLQTTVSTLQTNFAIMNASLVQLNQTIDSLNSTFTSTINYLQAEINTLNANKLGTTPDYDSGWWYTNQGSYHILTHNLGTTNVLVYMVGYNNGLYNQIQYGGDNNGGYLYGAFWSDLTTTSIRINRQSGDVNWPYIRVQIWKLGP